MTCHSDSFENTKPRSKSLVTENTNPVYILNHQKFVFETLLKKTTKDFFVRFLPLK